MLSPALEWHWWLESSGRREALREVVLVVVVSRSLNGMYLVPATGLSLNVTALSDGASETKSTAVSCSELSGGPERTEIS